MISTMYHSRELEKAASLSCAAHTLIRNILREEAHLHAAAAARQEFIRRVCAIRVGTIGNMMSDNNPYVYG